MNHFAAARPHAAAGPHFEVHRSALAEAGADAALGAAWVLLWLVFLLALAPAAQAQAPGRAASAAAGLGEAAACRLEPGARAQPDPGPSARGVARAEQGGAG